MTDNQWKQISNWALAELATKPEAMIDADELVDKLGLDRPFREDLARRAAMDGCPFTVKAPWIYMPACDPKLDEEPAWTIYFRLKDAV